ncbi:MAG: response regulator transcription factor [Pseudomonadota bacterium]|nr:response regulator transcription factor [Pseudomonadota bacterium]
MNSPSFDAPGVPQPGSALSEIRVLIADDHLVVREGLVAILNRQSDMTVVGEAGNGREALEQWRNHRPDVTLMDLRMPEMSGVEAIIAIREEDDKASVIILTTYDSDEDVYRGMRAGAKAYLLKDAHREELLNCIRAVYAGKTFISPGIAVKLASRLREEDLTPRELEILNLVAQGLSNKLIARALEISEGTVKTHVKNLLEKLDATSRTEALAVAARRGLITL